MGCFVLLLAGIHFSFHYSGDDLKLLNQTFGELVEKDGRTAEEC